MLLEGKNALVFAAAGAIGAAVARRLAAEGASVWLSGRTLDPVERVAEEIEEAGGRAHRDRVDATDEAAVTAYVGRVAWESGSLDLVFNAIGLRTAEADYATPSTTLAREKFLRPLATIAGSQFLTAREAARHMQKQGGGSIVLLSASLTAKMVPFMAGITAACGAIEGLTRSLAGELGPSGVRVNCLRSGGLPDTRTIRETTAEMYRTLGLDPAKDRFPGAAAPALGRPHTLEETAAVVAFLASDLSSGMTGQVVNVCAGDIVD